MSKTPYLRQINILCVLMVLIFVPYAFSREPPSSREKEEQAIEIHMSSVEKISGTAVEEYAKDSEKLDRISITYEKINKGDANGKTVG